MLFYCGLTRNTSDGSYLLVWWSSSDHTAPSRLSKKIVTRKKRKEEKIMNLLSYFYVFSVGCADGMQCTPISQKGEF
jgi:hypothetical protein